MKVLEVHAFVVLCFGLVSSTDKTGTDTAGTDIVIIVVIIIFALFFVGVVLFLIFMAIWLMKKR